MEDWHDFDIAIEWLPDDPADDERFDHIRDALIHAGANDITVTKLFVRDDHEHASHVIAGRVMAFDYLGAILDLLPYMRAIDDCFSIEITRSVEDSDEASD